MLGFSALSEFAWSEFPDIEARSSGVLEIEQIESQPTFTAQLQSEPTFTAYVTIEPEN